MEHEGQTTADVSVTMTEDEVVAGRPLDVTVCFVADHSVELQGGEVELVRPTAVTRFRRQWMGAAGMVSLRASAVPTKVELDVVGPLAAGQHLTRRTRLHLPPDEATIAGHLVQQQYAVRARIRLNGGCSVHGDAAVRVVSAADGRHWIAGAAPVSDDAGFAALGIEGASRELHEDVPVTGSVTVTPRQAGRARAVRVELVLDEHVPARAEEQVEEDRDAQTVVAVAQLAADAELQPGQPLRLPFTLHAPVPLPTPSTSTSEFSVRWLLRAVLDRPLRRDAVATLELCGVTAP